jgi:hypothetical protein
MLPADPELWGLLERVFADPAQAEVWFTSARPEGLGHATPAEVWGAGHEERVRALLHLLLAGG